MLGQAAAPEHGAQHVSAQFMGGKHFRATAAGGIAILEARAFAIADGREGRRPPADGAGRHSEHDDADLEMAFIRAQHRYLNDFTSVLHRLKSLIIASGLRVEDSVKEIRKWSRSAWAVGVEPRLALDQPLDHPDLEPIWRAADEAGLSVVHHSFSFGFPVIATFGIIDSSAGWHPIPGVRCARCRRVLRLRYPDRYPNIRFGIPRIRFPGWLPFGRAGWP